MGGPCKGKGCRERYSGPFTEDIAHGRHTHEGEPLVIGHPEDRPVRRSVPTRHGECGQCSGKRKKTSPKWLWPILIVTAFMVAQYVLTEFITEKVSSMSSLWSDDEDTCVSELGAMQNAGIDWTTGDIVSGFDGTWPMLEDQIVGMYDQIRTQNMRRSLIPVTLNGTSGYLVMVFTTANPDGVIAGFTEGYDANGLPVRGLTPLQKGDELIPIYPMLYDDGSDSDEFAEDTFEGDPIIVGDTLPVFEYVSLEGTDSTFYYCFQLTDIFGETELSDLIEFEM